MNNNLPYDLRLVYERLQAGAVEEAMAILEDKNFIFIEWQRDDITMRAEELGIELNEDQIWDILSCLQSNHDASVGINWDVIDYWIDDSLEVDEDIK